MGVGRLVDEEGKVERNEVRALACMYRCILWSRLRAASRCVRLWKRTKPRCPSCLCVCGRCSSLQRSVAMLYGARCALQLEKDSAARRLTLTSIDSEVGELQVRDGCMVVVSHYSSRVAQDLPCDRPVRYAVLVPHG